MKGKKLMNKFGLTLVQDHSLVSIILFFFPSNQTDQKSKPHTMVDIPYKYIIHSFPYIIWEQQLQHTLKSHIVWELRSILVYK
jgi:hypothetical protein